MWRQVLKSEAAAELIAAVRSVQRHQMYLTPQLQEVLIGAFVNGEVMAPTENLRSGRSLSSRETEIVELLANGKSNFFTISTASCPFDASAHTSTFWLQLQDCHNAVPNDGVVVNYNYADFLR
jgi:hypothetical protein